MTSLKTGLHQTSLRIVLFTNHFEKVIKQFEDNPYECLANSIGSWILSLTLLKIMHVLIEGEIF